MKNNIRLSSLKAIIFYLILVISLYSSPQKTFSQDWSGLSYGMDNWVHALCVYNGELIAGGQFTHAGGQPANYIARWNGISWSPLGAGTNGEVDALTVYNGQLVAGGRFTNAGGIDVNFIAQWDGTNWNDDLGGVGSIVAALTVYNGKLIAGGYFVEADNVTVNYIARRISGGWQAMGGGMGGSQGQVMTLGHYGNDLIAGGFFTTAGGQTVNHIAKWNDTAWAPLGTGISNIVYSLAEYNGELIAGGLFLSTGGNSAKSIAKWNGTTWAPLGSGITGPIYQYVFGLAVLNNELYAGGLFQTAGGILANGIAKWDGSNWSALGNGLYYGGSNAYGAFAVNTFGEKLIVGGLFTTAGSTGVAHIAQWSTPVFSYINVTAAQQGFYQPGSNTLNQSDVMEVVLCESTPPYNFIESSSAVIDSVSMTGTYQFTYTPTGDYYIVAYHRNCLETWSSAPVHFIEGGTVNYDFTSAANTAYGNNLKQVDNSPVRYALFSGDVNQDLIIDLTDIVDVLNDANIFTTGYVVTDVTGDNITDLTDVVLTYNNSANFVAAIWP
ncbi:MAG TPA: hypothetical protein PKC58_15870 [Ignavibacteria bacterium]|nr:hypothetical protein [Ignavibacteria bacterium]